MWLPPELAVDLRARIAAILTVLPEGAVVSDHTAGVLHGLWLPRDDSLHVTVPTVERPSARITGPRRSRVSTHRRLLAPSQVTEVDGLPVTTVGRTWCDLSATLSFPDLIAAGDSSLRAGAPKADLAAVVAERHHVVGIRKARQALPLLDARSRSRPESRLRVAVVTAGLPKPDVNEAVFDEHGQWLAEPDLSYPEADVAIEYQGEQHAEVTRLHQDVARYMDLDRAGWQVLYYTSATVFGHPETVVADVRRVLTRRAPGLIAGRVRRNRRAG